MSPMVAFTVVNLLLVFVIVGLTIAVVSLASRDQTKPMRVPIISDIKDAKARKIVEKKAQEMLDVQSEWLYGPKDQQGH